MGVLNCSCFNSKENGAITFNTPDPNKIQTDIPPQKTDIISDETLFNIISNHYSSKNYEIQKINPKEFSELINSHSNKILDEYEDKLDDFANLVTFNRNIGPLLFIYKDDQKSDSDFYYEGEFRNDGIINGKGIKIIPNNLIYKGEFLNGKYNGKGVLIKNYGSIFGNWEDGECKGKVIFKVDNEFEYEGNFENNKKNGFGIEKYKDGSQYEGNFVNNIKNGYGKYTFPNGELYEGNFENDLYNGQGKYIWSLENRKYEGEFKDGIIHGKGIYTYSDGTIYNGYFENGLKNGEGFIEFPDGKKYYGNWLNDESYGNGYLINGNEKIEVIFRHGKIISTNINQEEDNNINNSNSFIDNNSENNINTNKKIIKFNIECFAGGNNNINLNKFICPICNCFFVEPLKCFGCSSNFCKECKGQQNCNLCNNNQFGINDELIREMNEIVKIKCDKCEEILDYQASLNHFH